MYVKGNSTCQGPVVEGGGYGGFQGLENPCDKSIKNKEKHVMRWGHLTQ